MKKMFAMLMLVLTAILGASESKAYNKMFVFEYKIMKSSEISNMFWGRKDGIITPNQHGSMFYILGSVRLSSEAKFPTAMVEITIFDSKRKSLSCTSKLGWVGSANDTFFLIKLWDSPAIPEIKYDFNILMRK